MWHLQDNYSIVDCIVNTVNTALVSKRQNVLLITLRFNILVKVGVLRFLFWKTLIIGTNKSTTQQAISTDLKAYLILVIIFISNCI